MEALGGLALVGALFYGSYSSRAAGSPPAQFVSFLARSS
jgi:hypothetical protein